MKADLEFHRVIGRKVAPRDYGWGRPVDWPDVAPYEDGDEGFTALVLVSEGSVLAPFKASTGESTGIAIGFIDWGDGSPAEAVSNNVWMEHIYDFSTFASPLLNSVGGKIAKVVFTPNEGKHPKYYDFTSAAYIAHTPWLELHISGSLIESLYLSGTKPCILMRAVVIYGLNNLQNMGSSLTNMASLEYFEADVRTITLLSSTFSTCRSLKKVKFNSILLPANSSIASLFSNCDALLEAPDLIGDLLYNTSSLFASCFNLRKLNSIAVNNTQNVQYMFRYCRSLQEIPAIDLNNATNAVGFAQDAFSLSKCDVYNIGCSITFTNTRLSREELVKIFGNLKTVSGQTITITGSAGVASLTAEDRAIATGKGWTITG